MKKTRLAMVAQTCNFGVGGMRQEICHEFAGRSSGSMEKGAGGGGAGVSIFKQ